MNQQLFNTMDQQLFITPGNTLFIFQPVSDGFQVSIQKNHGGTDETEPTTHFLSKPLADQLRLGLVLRNAQEIT